MLNRHPGTLKPLSCEVLCEDVLFSVRHERTPPKWNEITSSKSGLSLHEVAAFKDIQLIMVAESRAMTTLLWSRCRQEIPALCALNSALAKSPAMTTLLWSRYQREIPALSALISATRTVHRLPGPENMNGRRLCYFLGLLQYLLGVGSQLHSCQT
ncbi:hypothetical protein AMTRI_Chr09g36650 [Amborella trichopoda]